MRLLFCLLTLTFAAAARDYHSLHIHGHVFSSRSGGGAEALIHEVEFTTQHRLDAVLWRVRVKPPVTVDTRSALQAALHPYTLGPYSDSAFSVLASHEAIRRVLDSGNAVAADEVHAHHKFSTDSLVRSPPMRPRNCRLKAVLLQHSHSSDVDHAQFLADVRRALEEAGFVFYQDKVHVTTGGRMLVMDLEHEEDALGVAQVLATFHQVHWIEREGKAELFNKFTRSIVQSGMSDPPPSTPNALPMWDHGLRGENQVVAIGDTGIDTDMCFFNDPVVPVPVDVFNPAHRKIVQYRTFIKGDASDAAGGHGTHTAGTLAGDVVDNSNALSEFNGMARKAKLAFYDLGSAEELAIPTDIYDDFMGDSYKLGARVMSNSWGIPDAPYDSLSLQTDAFTYDNPFFLPLFAAGNTGMEGRMTLSSPAVSKNALAVGASTSSKKSFEKALSNDLSVVLAGIRVDTPPDIAGVKRVAPALFGKSFVHMTPTQLRVSQASPSDGCSTLTNAHEVVGTAVLIFRGTCEFSDKAWYAQQAGAAMVMVVNSDDTLLLMGKGADQHLTTIPAVCIGNKNAQFMLSVLANVTISVPTTAPRQRAGYLAEFSSRGPTSDGRMKPDIVTPGSRVWSAFSDGSLNTGNCNPSRSVIDEEGTSMSTPLAAGTAALVRQYFMEGYFPSGAKNPADAFEPSAPLLKAVLINSGTAVTANMPLSHENARIVTIDPPPSHDQGFGQVTLNNALYFADVDDTPNPGLQILDVYQSDDVAMGLDTHQVFQHCYQVHSLDRSFRVTLVWNDPPPNANSLVALVNDLDLSVTHVQSGHVHLGNALRYRDAKGVTHHVWDDLNNVEQVDIVNGRNSSVDGQWRPETGLYTINVMGGHVPFGPQKFSLVITGNATKLEKDKCPQQQGQCPNDCSERGACDNGRCTCDAAYSGADCSVESTELTASYAEYPLQALAWEYFKVPVDPSQWDGSYDTMRVLMKRTSIYGDPDLFASVGKYPSRPAHSYSNVDCDPCGVFAHELDIPADDFLHEQVDEQGLVHVMIGVYGSCCEESTFEISWQPYKLQSNWLRIFLIVILVVMVIAILLFLYRRWQLRLSMARASAGTGNAAGAPDADPVAMQRARDAMEQRMGVRGPPPSSFLYPAEQAAQAESDHTRLIDNDHEPNTSLLQVHKPSASSSPQQQQQQQATSPDSSPSRDHESGRLISASG